MFDGVDDGDEEPDRALRIVLGVRLDGVADVLLTEARIAAIMLVNCLAMVSRYEMRQGRPANLGAVGVRLDLLRRALERRFGPL
jgi:hypothetical protein